MKYSINIALLKNALYLHYAKVELPEGTTEQEAITILGVFANKFPSPYWRLILTEWCETGTDIATY